MKYFFLFALLLSLFSLTSAFTNPAFHSSKACGINSKLAAGPATIEKPETVEKVDKKVDKNVDDDSTTEKDPRNDAGGWEIRLFNDPMNKREYVAMCLSTVCGKSDSESYQIMMSAHKDGMGVVGRYMFEVAELYYASLRENGLQVDMVPVEEE
jgi:ATP-dependent Clp protease adapter protein ClpS